MSTPAGPRVAVFGSSEPTPGSALYARARAVGSGLADAGFVVLTGGYGGVMDAASRGATERGGRAEGVLCALFGDRDRSPHLTSFVVEPDLFSRTRRLIDDAAGFVVLDGKAGTLAELAFVWALARAECLGNRPVVAFREDWREVVEVLRRSGKLEDRQADVIAWVDGTSEAVATIAARFG